MHVAADGYDFAGALHAQDGRGAGRRRIKPLPLEEVGAIERGASYLDEKFGGAGDRIGSVAQMEDRFVARFFNQDRFHDLSPRAIRLGQRTRKFVYATAVAGRW